MQGERETSVFLFHLFMHSLVILVCALPKDRARNLDVSGEHLHQLSYLFRASKVFQFIYFS